MKNNKHGKTIYRSSGDSVDTASKRVSKRHVFRLDSSAYYRAKKSQDAHMRAQAAVTDTREPDDLISPDIAAFLTTEIPVNQIVAGLGKQPRTKSAIENFPYDLGGHMTQTIEIPVINSEIIKSADTKYGLFVEFEETAQQPHTYDESGGVPSNAAHETVYMAPADYFAQQTSFSNSEFSLDTVTAAAQPVALAAPEPVAEALPAQPDPLLETALPEKPAFYSEIRYITITKPKRGVPPWVKKLFPPRLIAFAIALALLFTPLTLMASLYHVVYVHENGSLSHTIITRETQVDAIFMDAGLPLREADAYKTEQAGSVIHVDLTRSFQVMVTCDGQTVEHYVLDKTAAEALDELAIVLDADDETNIELSALLKPYDELVVYRVRYEEREVTETVPWQKVEKPSPLIGDGKRQVMNEGGGQDGEAVRVYRDKYVDGEFVETTMESERFTVFPRNVVTLVGQSDAVMSTVNGSDFCDIPIVDNAPTSYIDVIEEGVCTAYSFPPGTFGASGMHLFQGFVAVNTDVIPYGSLLYITSPSGKFVYGWAIAADVGTAMMEGRVDIDCFFETYTESALFGRKYLNIYIVKQLTQDELAQYSAVPGMFNSRIPR